MARDPALEVLEVLAADAPDYREELVERVVGVYGQLLVREAGELDSSVGG